jgi:hypothetical protein
LTTALPLRATKVGHVDALQRYLDDPDVEEIWVN